MIAVSTPIFWTEKLIGISIFLQSVEFLQIHQKINIQNIWTWELLSKDFIIFPTWIQSFFQFVFSSENFRRLIWIRLIAAIFVICMPTSFGISILFLTTLLVGLRWRGVFNGGSDSMTWVVLLGLTVATVFQTQDKVVTGCLWYIGLQTILSYFLAGLAKLKSASWRQGQALQDILGQPRLPLTISRVGCWSVLVFECTCPLIFIFPTLALPFFCLSLLFHLGNIYLFGLNRFLWAWMAAYPSLYYCIFYFH